MADPVNFTPVGAPTGNLTVTVPSLTPGTQYDLEVTATNPSGSATSSPITVTTIPGTPPAAVTGLVASQITTSSLVLTWTAVTVGTAPITYQPQLRATGQTAWSNFGSAVSGTTSAITGLAASTGYDFQIVATNVIGTSTSAAVHATTLTAGPPATAPTPPTNLKGTGTTNSISATWSASTGLAPITYQLQYRLTGATAWINATGSGQSLTGSITGLSPNVSYDMEVIATNSVGSTASALVTVFTVSAGTPATAPTGLVVTSVTPTAISLTWNSSSGTTPIAYQPQYRLSGTSAWISFLSPIPSPPVTITSLTAGTTYDFQVVATNAIGAATSAPQTVSTPSPQIPPSPPGSPVAWIIMASSVSLVWTASGSGTQPISYQIQLRALNAQTTNPYSSDFSSAFGGGGAAVSGSFILVGSPTQALSTTVDGLAVGVDYEFQVVATNAVGSSVSQTLTILAPKTGGGTVTLAQYKPNDILTAASLDASLNSKLDVTGGAVGPITIAQPAGGNLPAALTVSRTSGGLGDAPMISGAYTAVMADGPVIQYGAISMSLSVVGDASNVGPAGNMSPVVGALSIAALRSVSAPVSGSKHAAITASVDRFLPANGIPSGRRLSDGAGFYLPVTDHTGLPSSQSGELAGGNILLAANGADDGGIRYGLRIIYSEATSVSAGGAPAEFSRGLFVGSTGTTAYSKVHIDVGGSYGVAALDLRSSAAYLAVVTSSSPFAPVTALTVDRALMFTGSGSPAAPVTATNPKSVTINGNVYSVVSVSVSPGSASGILTFAAPVSAADARQGNVIVPASHTIWLSENSGNGMPGDIAFNQAGSARMWFDAAGGGLTATLGIDRMTFAGTSAVRIPVGSSAQRPSAPLLGDLRCNSDTGLYEAWQPSTGTWVALSGGTASSGVGTAPGAAGTVLVGTPTTSAVSISWSPPTVGTAPFTYQVQYRVSGIAGWINWGGPQSATSTTVSSLTSGTRYDFQIVTSNSVGSSTSAIASVTIASVAPSAPTGLTASSATSTTIALSWTASASGTAPISYQVMFKLTSGSTFAPFGSLQTGTSLSVTGLTAATSYDFQVVASNTGGQATSTTTTASTTSASTVAPTAPTSVTALSPTASSLVMSWTAPGTGTTPFSYQPFFRLTGASPWTSFGGSITGTSVTVTGLSAATSYDFEVTATNSAGAATSAVAVGITAANAVASSGTVSGSQTSGPTNPVISGPATGSVVVGNVLPITGITITDPSAATATGSCTLLITCTSGKVSSTVGSNPVSGSGTTSISYVNTLSACQTAAADIVYSAGNAVVTDNIVVKFTDQSGANHSISVSVAVTAVAGGGGGGGTIPTDATGTTAQNVQGMLNRFGVNTHLDQPVYQTLTLSTVENCINYLGGIKLLRDQMTIASDTTWWPQVCQATGTTFIAYIGQTNQSNFSTQLGYINSIPQVYIAAYEGCDEADTGQAVGFAETLSQAAAFQQTVFATATVKGKPTIQMSFGQGYDVRPTGNYGTVGNLAAYATYGNIHLLTGASIMSDSVLANVISLDASLPTPGKPAALTEFGWHQQATAGYNNASPATSAAYVLTTILNAFLLNCPYCCWNELLDDPNAGPIGLFDVSGTPRPAATAIKNFFTLLSDAGSNALTFSPGKLNYSISNFPVINGGLGGYQALFQKSDGTFWLALWNEQDLNDTNTGADIAVAPVNVTLTLGTAATSVTVYDPSISSAVVQSASAVTSMTISLPARVILVKIVHA